MTAKKATSKPRQTAQEGAERVKLIAGAITAIATIAGALGACYGFIKANLTDEVTTKLDAITSEVAEIRQDTVRLQLLELINGDPDNVEGILTVARTYFDDLGGDWYMTAKFKAWAEPRGIDLSDFHFQH